MKSTSIVSLTLIISLLFSSCTTEDPKIVNEEELITTIITTLTSENSTIILKSQDLDGEGPNVPIITVSGDLKTNTTYVGSTVFLNETKKPAEDITEEIHEEGEDHQLFYQAPVTIGIFTYRDQDKNGKPIGLLFTLKTGNQPNTGVIIITLRHLPIKNAIGVADGDISNAGGATDAQVKFPVTISN